MRYQTTNELYNYLFTTNSRQQQSVSALLFISPPLLPAAMEVAKGAMGDHKEVVMEAHLVMEAQPRLVDTVDKCNSQVTELNKLAVTVQEAEPLPAVTVVQRAAMVALAMPNVPATRSSTCQ